MLVDPAGICKISDFGTCARVPSIYDNQALKPLQGTIPWMAPEVMLAKEGYSGKVDVWSLGCLVVEMWTGCRPWKGLLSAQVIFKVSQSLGFLVMGGC